MIYIIVPTFNRIEDTKEFLDSINRSVLNKYLVLLIDDHQSKITFNSIKNNVEVLPSKKELWWVGECKFRNKDIISMNMT